MKYCFLVFLALTSNFAMADHWERDVSFYNGFGGTGSRMRQESIFVVSESGERRKVAQRILVDSSNELREIWTSERPGENTTPANIAIWESLSRHISSPSTPPPSSSTNMMNDCTMSDDQLSITCPTGLYVKSSSVNDSMRNQGRKETPSRTPAPSPAARVREE